MTILKTIFKILGIVITISFIIFISYDTTSNNTDAGDFWYYGKYCKDIEPRDKDIEASKSKFVAYQNSFILNEKQIVTIYRFVPNDPSSFYKGFAKMKNDTLYLDIKEERRLSHFFTTEMYACSSLFKFYFVSNKIPKAIYLWGQSIDSLKNQVTL